MMNKVLKNVRYNEIKSSMSIRLRRELSGEKSSGNNSSNRSNVYMRTTRSIITTTHHYRNTSNSLRGVFPSLSTPFKRMRNESISYDKLEKNLIKWSKIPFSGTYTNLMITCNVYIMKSLKL